MRKQPTIKQAYDLLRTAHNAEEELRQLGILRTFNSPVGDFGEWLMCNTMGWQMAPNSAKGYDATDNTGKRYQIKTRRIKNSKAAPELSALRDLDEKHFDYLAVLVLNANYSTNRACLVPHHVVVELAGYSDHVRASKVHANAAMFDHPEVVVLTQQLVNNIENARSAT